MKMRWNTALRLRSAITILNRRQLSSRGEERRRTDRYITFNPAERSLADFLEYYKPSQTPFVEGDWISVNSSKHSESKHQQVLKVPTEVESQCKAILEECSKELEALKEQHSELVGDETSSRRAVAQLQDREPSKQERSVEKLEAHRQRVQTSMDYRQKLLDVVRDYPHLSSGKWMFFPTQRVVEKVWAKVAQATYEGELGWAAKVGTNRYLQGRIKSVSSKNSNPAVAAMIFAKQSTYSMCVGVSDFSDMAEVERVLRKLQEMGVVRNPGWKSAADIKFSYHLSAFLKPDIFSSLGIYHENPWDMSPVLYQEKDFVALPEKVEKMLEKM
ncbi:hypothetical protein HK102_001068 [Quaeritorhiza haematococci]|nr:hypothetical protein HK102_001068 [Quaeritorhiza haematococci]